MKCLIVSIESRRRWFFRQTNCGNELQKLSKLLQKCDLRIETDGGLSPHFTRLIGTSCEDRPLWGVGSELLLLAWVDLENDAAVFMYRRRTLINSLRDEGYVVESAIDSPRRLG